MLVTHGEREMMEEGAVKADGGAATFTLQATSYTTLIAGE